MAARTRGELDHVMADLPSVPAKAEPSTTVATAHSNVDAQRAAVAHWRRTTLATWAIFSVFFVILWVTTGARFFWPMWPILGWGLGVALSGVRAHTQVESSPPEQHQQLPGPPSAP